MFLKTKLNQNRSIERVGNTTLPQKNNSSSTLRVKVAYLEDNPTLYKNTNGCYTIDFKFKKLNQSK